MASRTGRTRARSGIATAPLLGALAIVAIGCSLAPGLSIDAPDPGASPPPTSPEATPVGTDPGRSDDPDGVDTDRPGGHTSGPAPITVVAAEGVLGWWDERGWHRAEADTTVPIDGTESFELVGLGRSRGRAQGRGLGTACHFPDSPPGVIDLFGPSGWPTPRPLAVHGATDLFPRPVRISSGPNETYVDATGALLAQRGQLDPAPRLQQIVRSDLDGDGADEVIVVAERFDETRLIGEMAGDEYSLVFIRRLVGDRVETSVLHYQDLTDQDPLLGLLLFPERVAAVADLDGDGRMEVVLAGAYYEGSWVRLLQLAPDGGALTEIATVGCGG